MRKWNRAARYDTGCMKMKQFSKRTGERKKATTGGTARCGGPDGHRVDARPPRAGSRALPTPAPTRHWVPTHRDARDAGPALRGDGCSTEEHSSEGPGVGQASCLIADGQRCMLAGRRATPPSASACRRVSQKLRLDMDGSVQHLHICDFRKNFIRSSKRKRKASDDGGDSPEQDGDVPEGGQFQPRVYTLRRCKRHYQLQAGPGFTKAQLAETVSRHSRNIPLKEGTLACFTCMVKGSKGRLDPWAESGKAERPTLLPPGGRG